MNNRSSRFLIFLFVLPLYACHLAPTPTPDQTETSIQTPDPTATCYLQPQATGEKYSPVRVETPPPPQVRPGETITMRFSGGYGLISNNARICGKDNIVGYVYADELPSFPHRRTVDVALDNTPFATTECDNECVIEVTIPPGIPIGPHQLMLQIPRFRESVGFDVQILAESTPSLAIPLKFRGAVSRDQIFEQEISPNLIFRLIPDEFGWTIWVGEKAYPDHDFSGVVTPPYRGTNARYIMGWHFRNSDNSGPNMPGEKNVNAPQEMRAFDFVLTEADYQTAFDALSKLLWPADYSEEEILNARKTHQEVARAQGLLTITKLELGNLNLNEQAWFEYMEFEVELHLR